MPRKAKDRITVYLSLTMGLTTMELTLGLMSSIGLGNKTRYGKSVGFRIGKVHH